MIYGTCYSLGPKQINPKNWPMVFCSVPRRHELVTSLDGIHTGVVENVTHEIACGLPVIKVELVAKCSLKGLGE